MPVSRRVFLAQASLAACSLPGRRLWSARTSAVVSAGVRACVVRTPSGTLRGEVDNGVRVFRGVPFARAPIGARRFLPPETLPPWQGERDATAFSAAPMQPEQRDVPHSEDCLYLNIWTPDGGGAQTGKGLYPVFVWIHGGGFTGGHAFEATYDGTEFAREGIVVVTVAYRLGVFGFLDCEPLLGPAYAGTANNGLQDLIAALAWLRDHAAAFGGDPGRVTIGGESAGAKLTDILMGVPSAQPLFHQMISQSGGAERIWPVANSEAVSRGFADLWRKDTGGDAASLRAADGERLIHAQTELMDTWPQHFPLRPEIDGKLVPGLPVETIAAGSTRGKRLLIGTNREESALFLGPQAHAIGARDLGNIGLAKFEEVYRHYADLYPRMTEAERRIRAVTAEEYWVPSMRVVEAHLKGGGSAFVYELEFVESSGRYSGFAYHSLDTGMVWDHPHTQVADAGEEAELGSRMHLAWAAFIRGETPAAAGLPAWPAYNLATRPTMVLDTQSRVEERPQWPELRLWEGVL